MEVGYLDDYVKTEQINGVVYEMSRADYKHGIINGNIYMTLKKFLVNCPCEVFMENLGLKYHPENKDDEKKSDYVEPDIMIACEMELLKGEYYYGVPKFIVETASPSTLKRDRTVKMKIYEKMGVSEYWIVLPTGTVDVYYLKDGKYKLHSALMICREKDDEDYNENEVIKLREFPKVKITLSEIFRRVV